MQVQMLSESYENVAVFHVPLKKEVHSQKSTEEISKDNIEEKKKIIHHPSLLLSTVFAQRPYGAVQRA